MSKEAACQKAVLEYLVAQNRPYSAGDVTQNLRNEFSKGAVQKALEQLAAQDRLLEKEYGKAKVYCALQKGGEGVTKEQISRELQELDASITTLSDNLRGVDQQVRESDALLKKLVEEPTTEEAEAEVAALDARLQRLRSKVADLTDNCVKVSPEDRKKVARDHEKMLREYRKRKRMCSDILNSILEGYPKKKKDLEEEIGIETDEAVGCKL